jgi:hypothetical protein
MEVLCARAASEEIRRERFALGACMLGMGFGCEGGSEGDDHRRGCVWGRSRSKHVNTRGNIKVCLVCGLRRSGFLRCGYTSSSVLTSCK